MSTSAVSLDSLVTRAQSLCSLPAVAMKVLELTSNPQVDTRALKRCIENDPALTGKILRVVNSSLFGLSREVSDLNQALALLGIKPLKMLVLGFSLPGGLFAGVSGEMLGRYWRRTLTKAVAARELSETVWRTPGDEAFICGLLQDLGMLLLIQELGQPYVRFVEKVQAAGRDLNVLEVESMGFDHTTLSARLLDSWGLPDSVIDAVGHHADDTGQNTGQNAGRKPLLQIMHLAELVARLLVDGNSAMLNELLQAGRRYRHLNEKQLENLVANLDEKVRQLADVLSLQLPEGLEYRDVLVAAQSRLAEVAADVAGDLLRSEQEQSPSEESLLTELKTLSNSLTEAHCRGQRAPVAPPGYAAGEAGAQEDEGPTSCARRTTGRQNESRGSPSAATRSATDPDPTLIARLEAAVIACRQARCSLSLLLVEPNQPDQIVSIHGAEGLSLVRRLLQALCEKMEHPGMVCLPHGEAGFAVVLPDCDRRDVVELGNQVIDGVRRLASRTGNAQALTVGGGAATVALPPKNFPAQDLFEAATRCLNGSRSSGGNVMKSIEI